MIIGGVIIFLGIIIILIILLVGNKKVEEVNPKEEEKAPVIVDNFYYKDGYLHFLNESENEIGCLGKYPDKPLEEIWKNRKNNIFFKKRFAQNVACVKCKYFNYCKSGCMGYAQKFYGDINAPDGYCEYAKLIKLI